MHFTVMAGANTPFVAVVTLPGRGRILPAGFRAGVGDTDRGGELGEI